MKCDALIASLIQGEGNKKPEEEISDEFLSRTTENLAHSDTTETTTDLDSDIELLDLEIAVENTLDDIDHESNKEESFEDKLLTVEESLKLAENAEISNQVKVKDLASLNEDLPALSSLSNKESLAAEGSLKVNDSKPDKKPAEVKDFFAHDKSMEIEEALLVERLQEADDNLQLNSIDKANKKEEKYESLIVEDVVMQDAPVLDADEVTFVETLEIESKDITADIHTIETQIQPPNEEEMEAKLEEDLFNFDPDSLQLDESRQKISIEEDGSAINLMDVHIDDLDKDDLTNNLIINIDETVKKSNEKAEKELIDIQMGEVADIDLTANSLIGKKEKQSQEKVQSEELELQSLLNEIRQEADKKPNTKYSSKNKTKVDDYDQTKAEKRWALLCGNKENNNVNKDSKDNYYKLNQHMLAVLLDQIKVAKADSKKVFRLKHDDFIIVINSDGDSIYCNYALDKEEFANFCFNTVNPDDFKIHELDYSEIKLYQTKSKENPEKAHSFEAFIWTVSLLTSRGRLLEHTDIKKKIGLKIWPNLTRIESFPHVMNIAAVFSKHPGSLKDVPQWLNIPQCYVFAFYNAAVALDMIEFNSNNLKSSKFAFKLNAFPEKNKERGFFGRLFQRLKSYCMSTTKMAISNKKIIFTGPVGSGKTTAIQTISDIPIVSTNEEASNMIKNRKPQTTVAMDYGCIKIDSKEIIHLYGTPGHERFSFMWDILTKGAVGLILLLDNSRDNPQQDLKFYIQSFSKSIQEGDLIIGVTSMDEHKTPSINDYRQWLDKLSVSAPVFTVDAREHKDVSLLVQALLYSLDPGIAA